MLNDPNSEILKQSELAVKAAKKELHKSLDYSKDSLKNLELLIQHVRGHFSNLKKDGRLTDQIIQRACVSIGAYLGEVIRRHYGGKWIAKNAIMKTLVINGREYSPILYVFQQLTKDVDYSLDKYWSELTQTIQPQNIEARKPAISETSKKVSAQSVQSLERQLILILGSLVGIFLLFIVTTEINRSMSADKAASTAATQRAIAKATKTACTAEFENEMTQLLSDFFRQQNIADVTSRINLPEQISHLENIRRDAWNVKNKSCDTTFHTLAINYMDLSILTYISFAGDDLFWEEKYLESLVALAKLDDEIIARGRTGGLVQLFREKNFLYWEKLEDPNWKEETQG